MKRRSFVKSTLAAAGAGSLAPFMSALAAEKSESPREFYELRLYHLRRGPKQKLFDDFYREAAVPAMNRNGLGPVGIFHVMAGPDSATAYVLIPHASLDSFATSTDRVRADPQYQKAGAAFINADAGDPAYVRVESTLLAAFAGFPKIEIPALLKDQKPRLFELRTYESHSKKASKKKRSRKSKMAGVNSMEIFYKKHLWGNYPLLINLLVIIGIYILKIIFVDGN